MATHQILKKVKIDPFTGTSFDEQVSLWLSSLEDYYDAQETDADERLTATPLLFQKTAKLWWQGIRENFHANNGTWLDLRQALIARFEDPNRIQNARDALSRLRQVTSVNRYIEEFNVLRVRAGDVSEPEAIQRFRDGMKPALQQHFRGNPDHAQTLGQMQRIAGSLDNAWHLARNSQSSHRDTPNRFAQASYPQPMELDASFVRPVPVDPRPHARAERLKEDDYRQGNCFYCHEKGHRAVNCSRKRQNESGKDRS
jgi:hypothetical protein